MRTVLLALGLTVAAFAIMALTLGSLMIASHYSKQYFGSELPLVLALFVVVIFSNSYWIIRENELE